MIGNLEILNKTLASIMAMNRPPGVKTYRTEEKIPAWQ